jgi:HAMP domain-containing protein
MSLRRRSVLLQVALLVLIPLILLVGSFACTVTTAASSALTLTRSKVVMDQLRLPVAALQQALSHERERAVGQAEADLAASARSQADAKLRNLYLIGGLGLAAVVASLALSLWIAIRLTRRLRRLRDSALEMANVRLPGLVQRVRGGENVDVAARMPLLESSPDEIGQVKAAFQAAQRTAVEAAVDEARVRRGISDVFRNLARRSQALLERLGEGAALDHASGGSLTTAIRGVTAPPVAAVPPAAPVPPLAPVPPTAATATAPSSGAPPPVVPVPSANGDEPDVSPAWDLSPVSPPEVPAPRTIPGTDPPEPFSELDTGPASSSVAAPDEPHSAGSRFGLTDDGLPERIRQMSLAPQLRKPTASPSLADPVASSRSPEAARSVMSAFLRGWRLGLSGTEAGRSRDRRS